MNCSNNISFGSLNTYREKGLRRLTENQERIEREMDDTFSTRNPINGFNSCSRAPRTLADVLEEDMLQDVNIIHKRNGDVLVKLSNTEVLDSMEDGKDVIDEGDKPQITLSSKMSDSVIRKNIREFATKCRKVAFFYSKELSNILGAKLDEKIGKMTPADFKREEEKQKALDALAEEDRFREEFGTDQFN